GRGGRVRLDLDSRARGGPERLPVALSLLADRPPGRGAPALSHPPSPAPRRPPGARARDLKDFPIPDPLVWLSFIASATRTLKLGTAILILPQRNPVVTAKAVASHDHMARGGRVLLGIGVGWLAEEFSALGVPFDDRGPRADEYVAAMRALWSQERASFHGRFVSFQGVFCRPLPPGRRIPIIVGGDTRAAARRAGRLGDGYLHAPPASRT